MNGRNLKYIAMITMLIDHIGFGILFNLYGGDSFIYNLSRSIGRIAFPIFIFLLIEGFIHTKNFNRYTLNMFLFALISEVPFNLLNTGKIFSLDFQNVMFTMTAGLLMLKIIDNIKVNNHISKIICELIVTMIFCGICYYLNFDYRYHAPIAIYLYYKFRNNKLERFVAGEMGFLFESQSLVHIGLILVALYNGHRGKQNKYFFYAFYPIHLLLIYGVSKYLL